jgi:hypothetical protein
MKCVLITRLETDVFVGSSLHVADAIFVMLILEVFVARMAWGGQIFASCSKMDSLREGISGTASITKSTVDSSDMEVVGWSRALMADASSLVRRCFATSFSRSLSANARPLSRDACELSTTTTGIEAWRAATSAIPRP